MREIWFKAKRKDNGKWEEGYYEKKIEWHRIGDEYVKTERHYICVNMVSSEDSYIDRIEVVPETICQYTGLTDKNGNKIWENDIIWYFDDLADKDKLDQIRFNETHASFTRLHKSKMGLQYLYFDECLANKCEVLGNIFDNPELVKGGM